MLIVIEGADQAGKKTQTNLLKKRLVSAKISTKVFSFPDYTTPIGKEINRYLHGRRKYAPQVIHCLLSANRWEKLHQIEDAMSKHSVVLMNRYYQSNIVYGVANGIEQKWLENLDWGLPEPDLVILLDVSHGESFRRKKTRRDKFEDNKEFLISVRKIYRNMARKKSWKVIDASKSKYEIHEQIMQVFAKKIGL